MTGIELFNNRRNQSIVADYKKLQYVFNDGFIIFVFFLFGSAILFSQESKGIGAFVYSLLLVTTYFIGNQLISYIQNADSVFLSANQVLLKLYFNRSLIWSTIINFVSSLVFAPFIFLFGREIVNSQFTLLFIGLIIVIKQIKLFYACYFLLNQKGLIRLTDAIQKEQKRRQKINRLFALFLSSDEQNKQIKRHVFLSNYINKQKINKNNAFTFLLNLQLIREGVFLQIIYGALAIQLLFIVGLIYYPLFSILVVAVGLLSIFSQIDSTFQFRNMNPMTVLLPLDEKVKTNNFLRLLKTFSFAELVISIVTAAVYFFVGFLLYPSPVLLNNVSIGILGAVVTHLVFIYFIFPNRIKKKR